MPLPPTPPVVYVKDAPTRIEGRTYKLAPGATIIFKGPPPPFHRKVMFLTNEDTSKVHVVYHGTVDSKTVTQKLMTLWPNTTIPLYTSADIAIKNVNSEAVIQEMQITEFFYV